MISTLLLASQLAFALPPDTLVKGDKFSVIENGKTLQTGKRNHDGPHGLWKYYNTDGRLTMKEKYRKGIMIWRVEYSERGKIIRTTDRKGNIKTRPDCGC